MANRQLHGLLGHIRQFAGVPAAAELTDRELLERFVAQRDETAFATLVGRHGSLVLGVCRRVLRNIADAEDAFQATFLVLARKAGVVRWGDSVGNWLYQVAYRIAANARTEGARRQARERQAARLGKTAAAPDVELQDLCAVLDEELRRLPAKYRAPLLLCYLEGLSRGEAARQLGWSLGALKGRLERGRQFLGKRLARRGVSLSAVFLAAGLSREAVSAAVPASLATSTLKAAVNFAAGSGPTSAGLSVEASKLAQQLVKSMLATKLKMAMGMILATCLLVLGVGVAARQMTAGTPTETDLTDLSDLATFVQDNATQARDAPARIDRYGDPLPAGALARLGTVRLRQGEGIQSVDFSPDGKTLASTAGTKFVSLWDRSTGKEIQRIQEASGKTLAFSPDGHLLATAGGRYVELWDVAAGKRLYQLPCQTFTEKDNSTFYLTDVPLEFSADGSMVTSVNAEHVVLVWDVATGKELMRTAKQASPIAFLRFLPGAKTLISLSGARESDGAIQFWEIPTGKEISKVVVPCKDTRTSRPFAISRDGKSVAIEALIQVREKQGAFTSVYTAHCIRILDAVTGQQRLHIQGKNSVVESVEFSPDSRCLAWTNMENEVTIWDTIADKLVSRFRQAPGGFTGGAHALAYDREGKTLATSSQGSALHLWDLALGRELLEKEAHASAVHALVYSPDGQMVASASADQSIRVWSAKSGSPIAKLTGHESPLDALTFSPDGRHLATAATDRTVRLWDLPNGREIHKFTLPDIDLGNGSSQTVNRSLVFTPDSQTLIAAGSDLKFYRWDAGSGKELRQQSWTLHGAERSGQGKDRFAIPPRVRFSPDARTAATTTREAIYLVDVISGREFAKLEGAALPEALAFSGDSRTLVAGGWDKVIRIWEAASAKKLREIRLPDFINSVAVSPDGRIAAAGCGWNPASIHLFDVLSGKEILTFTGLTAYIGALDFAPDGKTLASGHRDATGLIWDVSPANRQVQMAPKELGFAELEKLWTDLESEDATKANSAAWSLTCSPKTVPVFLKNRLPLVPKVTEEKLQKLIADLDADDYAKRQAASQALTKLGTDAHAELRKGLVGKLSLEARRRIEALLDGPTRWIPTTAQMRRIRAIWVLEKIGDQEAVALLRTLAQGAPAAPETQEARVALDRLSKRKAMASDAKPPSG
ncbi:MAG TPA: sigma-70 family RNA polymerase sigma factor [Gemmataceae bacterium]|nr:sigma-70 family RNA polymerase sigma factor [Gemmataceae bacterium]